MVPSVSWIDLETEKFSKLDQNLRRIIFGSLAIKSKKILDNGQCFQYNLPVIKT